MEDVHHKNGDDRQPRRDRHHLEHPFRVSDGAQAGHQRDVDGIRDRVGGHQFHQFRTDRQHFRIMDAAQIAVALEQHEILSGKHRECERDERHPNLAEDKTVAHVGERVLVVAFAVALPRQRADGAADAENRHERQLVQAERDRRRRQFDRAHAADDQ